jgi:predicted Zn finger-like uncharacterized protein
MKVTCQQCGAAYSVADSKVEGRKVKLRCKQCDEAMIIDGTAIGAGAAVRADAHDDSPATPSVSAPALEPATIDQIVPATSAEFEPVDENETAQVNPIAASWHIAVGDQTQGPYALDEVARYYAEGRISADTLVYFDGASDWRAASEVVELTDAAAAFAPPPLRPTVPPPRRAEPRRVEPVTMGSDPFDDYAPAPVTKPLGADDMLSSTCHEGTVQFSLDAIRAISSVSTPSVVPAAVASSSSMRPAASGYLSPGLTSPGYTSPGYTSSASIAPGYASGEGSGLIDVSALSAQQHEETPFHVISSAQRSPLDMTSSFGTLNEARGGVDLRTKIFAGLTAFGFVLVAGVTALVLTQPQAPQPVAAASVLPTQAGMAAIPVPAPAPAPVAAAPAERAAVKAEPAAAEPSNDEAADEPAAVASKSRPRTVNAKRASGKRASAEVATAKAPVAAAKEKEPKAKAGAKAASSDFDDLLAGAPAKKPVAKGGDSIDDLLDSAVSAKKQPPKAEKAEAPAASSLPATASREDMKAAYNKAAAKAAKCKGSGVANADVTVAGSSGRATSVNVSGVEGAAKSCVESAVRSTSFPKFAKDTMQVKFPFKLAG